MAARIFQRILVTGGAGFVGSCYVRDVLARRDGTEITVLDKLTYAGNEANLAPVRADPERFGVAELDAGGRVLGFEEKPAHPKSDLIPIGVYFLRPDAFEVIEGLAPSGRGELEITDVLNHYIPEGGLFTRVYDGHWTDAGTVPSLLRAAELAREDHDAGRLAPPIEGPTA